MNEKTVVVLGAGATKACGGPLTNEILPGAFRPQDEGQLTKDAGLDLSELERFLFNNFSLPKGHSKKRDNQDLYPGLPMLLSLLDTAIERNQDYGPGCNAPEVRELRQLVEYAVYQYIKRTTRNAKPYHQELVTWLNRNGEEPSIVSLNYDTLVDDALRATKPGHFPDYGCDLAPPAEHESAESFGKLFKIHGSLNWLYCSACNCLEAVAAKTGAHQQAFSAAGYPCSTKRGGGSRCGARMRHIIITPTHKKRYGNPHITSVWLGAERALRAAERAILIGYSLPWDDVEVIYLLQRGLAHLKDGRQITVVEHAGEDKPKEIDKHEVGKRYALIFGRDIDWQPVGFKAWLDSVRGKNE
jgi:NAD-dependent SIR2 family protein deacetylase